MNVRHKIARRLGIGVAGFWLLSAAAIGGTVLLGGCDKIDDLTSEIEDLTSSDDDGGGTQNLTVQPAASTVAPKSTLGVTATATDDKGAPAKDGTPVSFTVDVGSIAPAVALTTAGKAAATYTAGATEGTAKITATASGANQTVSIQVKAGTAPAPAGGGAGGDMLDPKLVSWDESAGNVGAWAITAKIASVSITHERYSITRDPMDNWPSVQLEGWTKPAIGNWWLIGKCSDGRWHGATVDWLGPGRTYMKTPEFNGNDAIHGCLGSWRPTSGETAYAMQSTHARSGVINNNRQRTNIHVIKMP